MFARKSFRVRISSRESFVLIWTLNLDDRLSETLSVLSTIFSACSMLYVGSRVNSVSIV